MSSMRHGAVLAAAAVALLASPSEARFGKAGSSSGSSSSSSSRSSSSSSSTRVSSGSSSSGNYHAAVPAGSSSSSSSSWSFFGPRPVRYGYYSGAYVPWYGYGYCQRTTMVATTGVVTTGVATTGAANGVEQEEAGLRVTAGVEGLYLTAGLSGYIFGGGAMVEGERWGLTLLGQDIGVRADDGSGAMDHIGVLTARLSYAFLTGKYGRLRVEGGADTVIAPNLVAVGPVLGVSGSVWIYGPLALEGSAFIVPWPYWELDWRAGLVLGVGPIGLRVGWRTQVLDDRGWVDGVIHRDAFMGPYAGLSIVF